jgi:predicted ATPase
MLKMLASLTLKNFTAFTKASFGFSPGLNVIVGENATGKTHVLKVAYSILYVLAKGSKEHGPPSPTKAHLQAAIANKLIGVLRPDGLGRLARRDQVGRQRSEVHCRFLPSNDRLQFSFNAASKSEVLIENSMPNWLDKLPVYFPTRELLTIYPGFVSLYETAHLPFEETWRDTCVLLGAPLAKGPRTQVVKELLHPLEKTMGGKVEVDEAGRFYLNVGGVSMEMHLVAEGLRKLAMIARLVASGSLVDKGFLFWDEPEANLNPKIIKLVARVILHLCEGGVQVFIATHSLFLMREIDILLRTSEFADRPARFFGLDALQEELSQSDRFLKSEAS